MKTPAVPNDAQLIQLVRGHLGRDVRARGTTRLNVSSCGRVVTLHGVARDPVERSLIEEATVRVPGVRGVVNKLVIPDGSGG